MSSKPNIGDKRISVIVPTYRAGDYLWECLESLKNQTLSADKWELLIILNGCDEPWRAQIAAFIEAHTMTQARLVQTDTAGVSNARNIGLDQAQGEYITFVDDDDYVSPRYLEELLTIAAPDTIAAAYTRAFSDTKTHILYRIEREYLRRAGKGKQPFYQAKKYFSGPCMKLIHREVIGKERFDIRFDNGEDSLFMFAISCRCRYIQFTDTSAVYYRRVRSNSISLGQSRYASIKNRLQLMKAYSTLYWSKLRQYRLHFYLTRLLGSIYAIIAGK